LATASTPISPPNLFCPCRPVLTKIILNVDMSDDVLSSKDLFLLSNCDFSLLPLTYSTIYEKYWLTNMNCQRYGIVLALLESVVRRTNLMVHLISAHRIKQNYNTSLSFRLNNSSVLLLCGSHSWHSRLQQSQSPCRCPPTGYHNNSTTKPRWRADESRNKLVAEATPEEIKLILRWIMDFRSLVISLPDNKHTVWSISRHRFSKSKRIGNLNLPFRSFRHDIAIRTTFLADCENGITVEEQVTLHRYAHGVPTRFRADDEVPWQGTWWYRHEPTLISTSDTYQPFWFVSWRFELQPGLRFWASNNLLKFMALIISPWIDILAGRFNCAQSMTDSTMSVGWIRKTNFKMDNVDPIEASTPHIHRVWHKGVLTVVRREEESSRRCPLSRVRTIGLWPH